MTHITHSKTKKRTIHRTSAGGYEKCVIMCNFVPIKANKRSSILRFRLSSIGTGLCNSE